jgi:hypothetical protein
VFPNQICVTVSADKEAAAVQGGSTEQAAMLQHAGPEPWRQSTTYAAVQGVPGERLLLWHRSAGGLGLLEVWTLLASATLLLSFCLWQHRLAMLFRQPGKEHVERGLLLLLGSCWRERGVLAWGVHCWGLTEGFALQALCGCCGKWEVLLLGCFCLRGNVWLLRKDGPENEMCGC